MPLYEYTCRKCQHTFETLVSSRTTTVVTCPKCESEELDQLIGLPAPGRVIDSPATNCRETGRRAALRGVGGKIDMKFAQTSHRKAPSWVWRGLAGFSNAGINIIIG